MSSQIIKTIHALANLEEIDAMLVRSYARIQEEAR